MTAVLRAQGLDVRLDGNRVLAGIDLLLEGGSVTAVLGQNGSGKSTLIRALSGLIPVGAGHVEIAGTVLTELSARERGRHIACLLQDNHLAFDFSAREVVAMGVPPEATHSGLLERVIGALDALGLTPLADRLWGSLSGGERQRVHIARLLAARATLVLLDEPWNHLDLATRVSLRSVLAKEAARGAAVLFSTHDLEEACLADRVLLLDGGSRAALGSPEEVLTPASIERVFGVRARTLDDPQGGPPAFRLGTLHTGPPFGDRVPSLNPRSKDPISDPCTDPVF